MNGKQSPDKGCQHPLEVITATQLSWLGNKIIDLAADMNLLPTLVPKKQPLIIFL